MASAPIDIEHREPSTQSKRGLDWMNFFLADVRDGVGPFLAIYLLASHQWSASAIGVVMGAMGVATGLAQIPAGQWMDRAENKRLLLILACVAVAIATPMMTIVTTFPVVLACQIIVGAAAAFPASRRSRWAWSDRNASRRAPGATRRSTMRATSSPP